MEKTEPNYEVTYTLLTSNGKRSKVAYTDVFPCSRYNSSKMSCSNIPEHFCVTLDEKDIYTINDAAFTKSVSCNMAEIPHQMWLGGGSKEANSTTVLKIDNDVIYYTSMGSFSENTNSVEKLPVCPWMLCIIGPSGSGKDTLAQELESPGPNAFKRIISWTSRPKRRKDDLHIFASYEEIQNMIDTGFMPVWSEFDGNLYGISCAQIAYGNMYVVDPHGFRMLQDYRCKSGKLDKLLVVYLDIPEGICRRRMLQRGDKEEDIVRRIRHDKKVFSGFLSETDVPVLRITGASVLYTVKELKTLVIDFLLDSGVKL